MSRLRTESRMSNTGYHQLGEPTWWARVGSGPDAQFLRIPRIRGDEKLDCDVDVPAGTTVFCGAGKGHKQVRETVVTTEG